jgi:hypothetical protein
MNVVSVEAVSPTSMYKLQSITDVVPDFVIPQVQTLL